MPFRRALIALGVAAATLAAGASVAHAASPSIVVSQVYGGGGNSGAPFTNDFVELFNRGATSVRLDGWSIQYASATGTGAFGASSSQLTPLSGSLDAGQYLLVQEAASTAGSPLPRADVTDETPINLSGTAGKVALVDTTASLACNGSTASPCNVAALAHIVDLVGYGNANFFEGKGAAPTLGNATAAFRRAGGCTDTDDNAADFTAASPSPRNRLTPAAPCTGTTDAPPAVASTVPANGAADVAVDTNLSITFSEPVTVTDPWFRITCTTSGDHGATVSGGPTTFVLDPTSSFVAGESCTTSVLGAGVSDVDTNDPPDHAADFTWTVTTSLPPVRIHEIQGAAHVSPLAGKGVSGVVGIVTQKATNGFYFQDPQRDADPATSEGIFVFGTSAAVQQLRVGDLVKIAGRVQEFGGSASNLSTTEISSTTVQQVISHDNLLPAPTRWDPPTETIEDDALAVFDPQADGLDYAESLEGMRVELDDATATGPSKRFTSSATTEVPLVDSGAGLTHAPGLRTPRGGIVIRADDLNPERLILQVPIDSLGVDVNVGDHFPGAVVGALDYNFGNYKLKPAAPVTVVSGGLQPEVAAAAATDQLAVATFNLENLDPGDGAAKFDRLAHVLVTSLGSPGVVALEEVQDNNGPTDDGTTNSDVTLNMLVAAITAAGGPDYRYRYVEPVNDKDGGEPGGNIRVAFLFRPDAVSFVERPGAGSLTPNAVIGSGADTHLAYSPGRIDPTSGAWTTSRKPLAAEFTYNGHRLFVIANHFNSKSGDDGLYGAAQPPVRASETQRHKQAEEVKAFVGQLLAADANANVVVAGDLNDFQFSDTLSILESGSLHALIETLPPNEQYTYDFDGNSQAIDHILLGPNLFDHSSFQYDVVHVNSEFGAQSSDHDPQVVRLLLPRPTITGSRAPAANAAGWNNSAVTVEFACVDPLAALVACPAAVTLTGEGANQSVTRSSATKGADTVSATVGGISIDLTSPVVAYSGNRGTYGVDETVDIRCAASDALSGVASTTCKDVTGPAWSFGLGSHTFSADATDVAGNSGTGSTTFTVTVTTASLCGLTMQLETKDGVAHSLCVKLEHGQLGAYANELRAQSGKSLTDAQAALLTRLADALR